MLPSAAANQLSEVMILVLYLSMPAILVASGVGLLISLLQALTQVQEQTLPFAVKLIAVSATIAATASFTGNQLIVYTGSILDSIPRLMR
jgi:type III secretion protein S